MSSIPNIQNLNGIPTLYVHGKPFFALGGELHNSSASSLNYMAENVWPNLKDLSMNTVLLPLYWEAIEPVEGVYDFTLLDGLVAQARENDMHLVFLWFGLWKNAESMYVPEWMKADTASYFRARKVTGEPLNTISPLCSAAVEKDAKAFSAVMAYIRDIDMEQSTVIFMQVENEVGLLGTERDYSEAADALFAQAVPGELAAALNVSGTWREAFGVDAEESFMAWHFARAVEKIAAAGRAEYPIPCYTNAWLKQHPWYAGSYPSGGPVTGMHPIWKAAAPSLFALGPDIYVPYAADIMDEYAHEGNPLVIPEVRKDAATASCCLYAFGRHNAICYSPFGIEELALPAEAVNKPPMEVMIALNIDPSAFEIEGSKDYLARTYGLIREMEPIYLAHRGTEHLRSYVRRNETDCGTLLRFEKYDLTVAYSPKMAAKPLAAGMVYELDPDTFLIVGMQSTFTFRPKAGENVKVGVLRLEEGGIVGGKWEPGRILNGDEVMSLRLNDMPACLKVKLYQYG